MSSTGPDEQRVRWSPNTGEWQVLNLHGTAVAWGRSAEPSPAMDEAEQLLARGNCRTLLGYWIAWAAIIAATPFLPHGRGVSSEGQFDLWFLLIGIWMGLFGGVKLGEAMHSEWIGPAALIYTFVGVCVLLSALGAD